MSCQDLGQIFFKVCCHSKVTVLYLGLMGEEINTQTIVISSLRVQAQYKDSWGRESRRVIGLF
jgi:hypothetical protein